MDGELIRIAAIARRHGLRADVSITHRCVRVHIPWTRREADRIERGEVVETVRSLAELRTTLGY